VAAHPDTRRLQPLLVEALIEGASPQLRNMASIGGNLMQRVRCPYFRMLDAPCNKRTPGSGCSAIHGINGGHAILGTSDQCVATHPSDLAVALVALDAVMRVRGPQGERAFPVEDLYRLPGDTPHLEHTLRSGELIVEVRVPAGRYASRARYLKVRDPLFVRVCRGLDCGSAADRGRRDTRGENCRGRRRNAALADARVRIGPGRQGGGPQRVPARCRASEPRSPSAVW